MPCCAELGCYAKHQYAQDHSVEPVMAGTAQFAPFGTKAVYAPDTALSISHIEAHLDFDFVTHRLDARVIITIKNTLPTVSTKTHLDLNAVQFANIKVGSMDGSADVRHSYENSERIALDWTLPFQPNELRKIEVTYTIENPVAGLYWRRQANGTEYVVTDHETERARYWLPCIDFPTIRQTLHFFIKSNDPKKYTALANGSPIKGNQGADVAEWKLDQWCPSYLICVAVGEFESISDGVFEGIDLKYFAPKGTPHRDLMAAFDKTKGMISWMQQKLGMKLPWSKYYQICIYPTGGAMENISLVTFSDLFLMDERLEKDRKYLCDMVNLHEMAHTYFGDAIVVRYFEHAWLKESWATYMEGCWMQDCLSQDDFTYEMFDSKVNYINECSTYVRPIVTRNFTSSWTMFDRHLYPGGAWRLHMLRHKLGDDIFWTAVRAYVQRYAFREPVETADFKRFLEEHSGNNLTQFFDEWIYGKGFPKLKGSFSHDTSSGKLSIELEQTQVAAEYSESKRGAEYGAPNSNGMFHFDLEVEITDSAGKTHENLFRFEHESKAAISLNLPAGVKPIIVRFDPLDKILFSLPLGFLNTEILAETAQKASNMFSRIHSYEALAEKGTWDACQKIKEAVQHEKFWGVRQRLGDAIAKNPTRHSIDVLAYLVQTEPSHLVHFPLFRNARLHADAALRNVVLERIAKESKTLSYRGLGALYEALGHQRHEDEDLSVLTTALADDSLAGQHGLVRQGIIRGIAGFKSETAWEALKKWATPEALKQLGDYVTPVLIDNFGGLCEHLPPHYTKKTVEILKVLLSQPMHPHGLLTDSIARSLAATMAQLRYGAVDKLQPLFAKQDWPWLQKQVAASRRGAGEVYAGRILENIEKWETKYKDLEGRVTAIEKK